MSKASFNKISNAKEPSIQPLLLPYAGMHKEQLLLFSRQPFWVYLRNLIFLALISSWIILFIIAIVSIAMSKSCQDEKWWKYSTIYEVYPRSFQDSNGDGIGDIKGLISRLDYFNYLGVDAIWLTPVYKSPMKDFGYDISDYKDIDPLFGNLSDFKALIQIAHKKAIKVIMDFVPNHSSLEHPWFNMSCQEIEPYQDYYVWKNGKLQEDGKIGPPNNWLSVFGGSAWTWNSQRSQFYYHTFLKEQPDLNLENPKVVEELKEILKFWLDLGVDGFRFDAVSHMHEDQRFFDEPINDDKDSISASKDEFNYFKHIYVKNQPKNFDTLLEFSKFIRDYEKEHKQTKLMMIEDYDESQNLVKYYENSEVDFPFNFAFVEFDSKSLSGWGVHRLVQNWIAYSNTPKRWPNWVTGNHDRHRLATRFGDNMTDAMHMLLFLLPGTINVYYGDEIGMNNIDVPPFTETQDTFAINMGPERYKLYTRDPERSPMQWDSSVMAGFTSANGSWLPLNPDYLDVNVEVQKRTPFSHLRIFRALIQLRRELAFRGLNISYGSITQNLFSFARWQDDKGKNGYFIILNVGRDPETYAFSKHPPNLTPTQMKVILYTGNMNYTSDITIGKMVDLSDPYKNHRSQLQLKSNSNETNGVATEVIPNGGPTLLANGKIEGKGNFELTNQAKRGSRSRRSYPFDPPLHLKPGQGLVLGWGSSLTQLTP